MVAVPSLLQIAVPRVLEVLSRQPALIGDDGRLWRLFTSELGQDGGLVGTLFNLVVLYVVACVAVARWGPLRAVVLFLVGAVAFDVTMVYAFPAAGAGNSGPRSSWRRRCSGCCSSGTAPAGSPRPAAVAATAGAPDRRRAPYRPR